MSLGAVFPQLQPHEWPGLEHSSCRALFPSFGKQEEPWVSFFYPLSPLAAFVGPRRLEKLGQTLAEVEKEAIANLSGRKLTWAPVNLQRPDGGLLGVLRLDDDFAAECVLCPAIAREPTRVFRSPMVAVGIPRRGRLLAVPTAQVRDGAFRSIVRQAYDAAPRDIALTPSIFILKGGVLAGRLD